MDLVLSSRGGAQLMVFCFSCCNYKDIVTNFSSVEIYQFSLRLLAFHNFPGSNLYISKLTDF